MSSPTRPLRILFLTKRQYMGRDVISDRYGRFREVPLELAARGHKVMAVTLSYRRRESGIFPDVRKDGAHVDWISGNLGYSVIPGLVSHLARLRNLSRKFRPDVIFAASDAFHVIFAHWLARTTGTPFVVDLYDNFESYTGTTWPPVHHWFVRAVRNAGLVSCVSEPLRGLVQRDYHRTGPTIVLENAVRKDIFWAGDKVAARKRAGLPESGFLFGTAGALARSRDIEILFRAAERLSGILPDAKLVVAGPRDEGLIWPSRGQIVDLGSLPPSRVGDVFRSLDVMVTVNRDSAFGAYCFPQKLAEAVACETPIVVPDLVTMRGFLGDNDAEFYKVGDAESLSEAILRARNSARPAGVEIKSWAELAEDLDRELAKVLA